MRWWRTWMRWGKTKGGCLEATKMQGTLEEDMVKRSTCCLQVRWDEAHGGPFVQTSIPASNQQNSSTESSENVLNTKNSPTSQWIKVWHLAVISADDKIVYLKKFKTSNWGKKLKNQSHSQAALSQAGRSQAGRSQAVRHDTDGYKPGVLMHLKSIGS